MGSGTTGRKFQLNHRANGDSNWEQFTRAQELIFFGTSKSYKKQNAHGTHWLFAQCTFVLKSK
jgi:hypothetical protein